MGDSGKLDELKGRLRKGFGEVTDNPEQKQKGTVEKISGNVKQGIDQAKEKAHELIEKKKV